MLHLAAAQKNCSAPPPAPAPVCPVQVGAVLGGCPPFRDAQTVAEVLAQAGTPALFVPPAASEISNFMHKMLLLVLLLVGFRFWILRTGNPGSL